ncbi:unnamed protein product, partial [Orchesella dallaii]
MSAVVKRTCRLAAIKDNLKILSAEEVFRWQRQNLHLKHYEFIYITKEEVSHARETLEERYSSANRIPGL